MELVNIVSGRFSGITVGGYSSPHLILHNEHSNLFQLISQLLDVKAHQAVVNIHICPVIEQLQRTFDVNLQCSRHMMGFLFILFQQCVIQILQNRHIFRFRVIQILLINLMNTAVNDRFLNRL